MRLVRGLPDAAWADVTPRADDDIWLAGGLATTAIGRRRWPAGEGILVHIEGRAFPHLRAPEGALLAAAAIGPGEAWAVGVGGSLVHAHGGELDAQRVRPASILRAVAARAPDDVIMAGDEGAILRWDGRATPRIDATAVGLDGALTSIEAPGAGPGWVVGPAGVFRLIPRR